MPANQREPHRVWRTRGLVNEPPHLHAPRRAHRPQPVDVVLDDEQAARRHQRGQQVVVLGQIRHAAHVLLERLREPHVLRDDLRCRLDVLARRFLLVRDAPARRAARARLLRDRERDARVERARDEGALAVARAPRHADAGRVDARGGGRLERVDDPADAPRPRRHRPGAVPAAVERVEFALAAAAGALLRGEVVVVEGDSGDAGRDGDAGVAVGDDGRVGRGARGGVRDGDGEGDGLAALLRGDGQGVGGERGSDGGGFGGLGAQLVGLEELADLLLAAGECRFGRDLSPVGEGEGVGQFGLLGWRISGWESAA